MTVPFTMASTISSIFSLFIYNQIPDQVDLYLIPNQDIEDNGWLSFFQNAHNKFINNDDLDSNKGLKFLLSATVSNKYLEDDTYFNDHFDTSYKVEWRCVLDKYKQDNAKPIENVIVTRVFMSGFIL